MSARDLVNAIIAGEAINIENAFNSAISEKLSAGMDNMREQVAAGMFKEETELNLEDFSLEELQDFVMSEDFDQLDELSKETLGKYIKKASRYRGYHGMDAGAAPYRSGDQKDAFNKMDRRQKGIEKAVNKLTKEETELDEAIKVSDSSVKHYEKQEGQKARGVKHWMFSKTHPSEFDIDKHGYTMQHGNYSDAKKKAIKVYKNLGHTGEIHLLG